MDEAPAAHVHSAHAAILLFDGACGFCDAGVRFVFARDKHARFLFCPLQSPRGGALLREHDLEEDALDTLVLLDEQGAHVRSDAALRIARRLGGAWTLVGAFVIVPRALRDAVYDFVARRRHRILHGRACELPSAALQERMLE